MHNHEHSHEDLHLEDLSKEKKPFYMALFVAFFFMILEMIGGFIANSLALISDALHMFADVGSLVLGLLIISIFKRPPNVKKSYGYQRAEVLGSITSAVMLWVLMFFLIYEGIQRLMHPPEVKGLIVFIIAIFGFIANLIMMKLLHPGDGGSLNIRAAYLHVIGDLLGSLGVIVSGIVIWMTNWYLIDPIITFLIAFLILRSSGKMILTGVNILMQGVPPHIDLETIHKALLAIEGVEEVHDLHVWALSSKKVVLSVHLIAKDNSEQILKAAHHILRKKYHIPHMTIQIEDPEHFERTYCYDCQKKGES